jgi:hypothetical protein
MFAHEAPAAAPAMSGLLSRCRGRDAARGQWDEHYILGLANSGNSRKHNQSETVRRQYDPFDAGGVDTVNSS